MGLFDRFNKKKNDVTEDKKSETVPNNQDTTRNDTYDDLIEYKVKLKMENYQRLVYYESLKKRLQVLMDLAKNNKIKLSSQSMDGISEWLRSYQEQKIDEVHREYLLNNSEIPDISLPEFPVGPDDIYYPQNNPFVLDDLESLLDYDNQDNITDYSLLDILLRPIKEDDELISVKEAMDLEKGRKI